MSWLRENFTIKERDLLLKRIKILNMFIIIRIYYKIDIYNVAKNYHYCILSIDVNIM